jgi:hypothetical protein
MALPDLGQTGSSYSFLDVTLDVSAERLTRGETHVRLRPKSFPIPVAVTTSGGSASPTAYPSN